LPSNSPVAVSFSSGPCAAVVPEEALFLSMQHVIELQVTWASPGICHITASSSSFRPLNFSVINAVPPVVMSPPVVRTNLWQRTAIITLDVPPNLASRASAVQLTVSSQNETVGSFPQDSVYADFRCSCVRVAMVLRAPGSTRVRAVFVQGPADLVGVEQVHSSLHHLSDLFLTFCRLSGMWSCFPSCLYCPLSQKIGSFCSRYPHKPSAFSCLQFLLRQRCSTPCIHPMCL
jgi:hypothetical protein